MTERLEDIDARIAGIGQLGAVVNAMRGIAAARAQQARGQLAAVDRYGAMIAGAIGQALALAPPETAPSRSASGRSASGRTPGRVALVLFCAEQGFAGAFNGRVLDSVGADLRTAELFVVGTRGRVAMAERGVAATWTCAMPSHSPAIPKLADHIVEALYARIATGRIEALDVVYSRWTPGRPVAVERQPLFPFDAKTTPASRGGNAPLVNLPPAALLADLTADHMHARLCQAALHAFAAENEARMEAMTGARSQIGRQLAALQAQQRRVRQEGITAEIIELAAGEAAARPDHETAGSDGRG